jgi:copper chaperone CopZ
MGCVRRVTLAIQSVRGVQSVTFDVSSETFDVSMAPAVSVDALAAAVRAAGEERDRDRAPEDREAWVLR